MKKFILEHKHALWALYLLFYMPWFIWLENHVTADSAFFDVATPLDEYIPFCEYFIIPYYLWFIFVVAVWVFLCIKDRKEFYRFIGLLYTGMTLSLIIYTVFPNGQTLRVPVDPDKNFCSWLVYGLHSGDTPTNVFPSLHVYNSVVCTIAILKSKHLRTYPVLRIGSVVLTVLICLATVFLKQHSFVDAIGSFILLALLYPFFYRRLPFLQTQSAPDACASEQAATLDPKA